MKRLVTLAIMVAFLLGTVGMVKAAELTISGGDFRVHGNYVTNPSYDSDNKDDVFNLYQRFRVNFNFVANENLRVVTQLQFGQPGDLRWGDTGVNQLRRGTESTRISFRQAYLQFNVPNTQIQVKAGHQWWVLPNTLGSHIWDSRAPGFVISAPINDMFAVTAGYARNFDPNWLGTDTTGDGLRDQRSKDNTDMFFVSVPITLDGVAINPFGAYVFQGKRANQDLATYPAAGDYKDRNIFFVGVNATLDMFDPIVVHADFNYGAAGKFYSDDDILGNDASKAGQTAGWIADLAVAYKAENMTPMIFALYESGESRSSAGDDKAGKRMPMLAPDLNFSSFGFSGSNFGGTSWYALPLQGPTGKMALGLKVTDISLMDKLTHKFLVAYYQGTNHKDSGAFFTTKENAWEVNFDTSYQMYENLAAIVELGYIDLDLDGVSTDASFKAAAGFRYRF